MAENENDIFTQKHFLYMNIILTLCGLFNHIEL